LLTDEYLSIIRESLKPVRFLLAPAQVLLVAGLSQGRKYPTTYCECYLLAVSSSTQAKILVSCIPELLLERESYTDVNSVYRHERVGQWILGDVVSGAKKLCDFLMPSQEGEATIYHPNRFPRRFRYRERNIDFSSVFSNPA